MLSTLAGAPFLPRCRRLVCEGVRSNPTRRVCAQLCACSRDAECEADRERNGVLHCAPRGPAHTLQERGAHGQLPGAGA
eukprot:8867928-Pyramimonas_sp.AAC.1